MELEYCTSKVPAEMYGDTYENYAHMFDFGITSGGLGEGHARYFKELHKKIKADFKKVEAPVKELATELARFEKQTSDYTECGGKKACKRIRG
jgi:hypothetical protein